MQDTGHGSWFALPTSDQTGKIEEGPNQGRKNKEESACAHDLFSVLVRADHSPDRVGPPQTVPPRAARARRRRRHPMHRLALSAAARKSWSLNNSITFGDLGTNANGYGKEQSLRAFGNLVYRLVELGHMRNEEGESIHDFDDVFEFSDEFKIQEFRTTLLIDEDDS